MQLRFVTLSVILACGFIARPAFAQKGYEFEVYEAKISPRGGGNVELHTNFVSSGSAESSAASLPLQRAFRSALEVSAGFSSWLEGSVYTVGYARSGKGLKYVGNRARLTAALPASSTWPVKFGISQEIGLARDGFAESRWAYEVSPIVEASLSGFSFVVNPALERGFGDRSAHRIEFEPRARVTRLLGDETSLSVEYYGGIGPVLKAEPVAEQHHQFFLGLETEVHERFDIGLSLGRGFTKSSDRGVIATKLEYHWGR